MVWLVKYKNMTNGSVLGYYHDQYFRDIENQADPRITMSDSFTSEKNVKIWLLYCCVMFLEYGNIGKLSYFLNNTICWCWLQGH